MQHEKTNSTISIGEYIKAVAAQRDITIVQLAKELSRDPSSISHLYNNKEINTELLWKISIILEYNFFKTYAKFMESVLQKKSDLETIFITVSNEKITIEEKSEAVKISEYYKKM